MMFRLMAFLALTMLALVGPAQSSEKASKARQEEVERRGAKVMPFSLECTLHIFTKTKSSGLQQAVATSPLKKTVRSG
jgi:hypothetical protein